MKARRIITLAMCLAALRPAAADEDAIRSALKQFFDSRDAAQQRQLAQQIEADPAYDRAHLSKWLHTSGLFEPRAAGTHDFSVELPDTSLRRIALRIPQGYDPGRAWPLIYCLHGTGGDAESILALVERLLGDLGNAFVLAAPDQYGEMVLHDRWPPQGEHGVLLREIRTRVNIDSDRVLATGYSKGGHACWTLAVLDAEQFAGIMPLAGSLLLPGVDLLLPDFLPATAGTRVWAVWGAKDTADDAGRTSPHSGIAGINRKIAQLAAQSKLPIVTHEYADRGHGDIAPPPDILAAWLSARRIPYPKAGRLRFRHVCQAQTAWLEGGKWNGPQWDDKPMVLEFREGEKDWDPNAQRAAEGRAYRSRLGELAGEVNGQAIRVRRKNLSQITVWLGDGMIDWSQPVTIDASGQVDFKGKLEPNLLVCLTQAARTRDFERLRWAGVRIQSGKAALVLTGDESEAPAEKPAKPPAKKRK